MVIIESTQEFEQFIEDYRNVDCILIPIFSDINKHPLVNKLSLMYVRLFNDNEYILPFNHTEAINLPYEYLYDLDFTNKKYTYDKKTLNHVVKYNNVIDVNLLYYMESNEPLDIDNVKTPVHSYYESKFYKHQDINTIIPILKHYEYCKKLSSILYEFKKMRPFNLYNSGVIDTLSYIEQNGIYHNKLGKLYTQYNIFTSTGRPSNRFGGINFAALNKKDGSRKPFVSRFKEGMLIEFDYDAFHIRLLADIVGYKFPNGSAHEYLMNQYGINDYNEAKSMTFKFLYGHIPHDIVKQIPFFEKVQQYIDDVWISYKNNNFIKSDIYKKRIYGNNLQNMNKNKLFNYLLQLTEFEQSMVVLSQLIPIINDYRSKLILYSYDSFLIDMNKNDGEEFISNIKSILECDGKYPTKTSVGKNYHEMRSYV